jgi:hypothetical protein
MDFADSSHIRALGDDIVNSYVLPDHGEAWSQGIGAAVSEVRKRSEASSKG